jgi:hypothetical protein
VFLNCPFDATYRPLFEAIVFAVHRCGFVARCALEDGDSDVVRFEKIVRMIGECELGIHDLSRVDTEGKFPRFNMPFELGLFLGARRYGTARNRRKRALILEGVKYHYQRFISDLAGQDLAAHEGKPEEAVSGVRQFLSQHAPGRLPGRDKILEDYAFFQRVLPDLLASAGQDRASLTYREFRAYVQVIAEEQAAAEGTRSRAE